MAPRLVVGPLIAPVCKLSEMVCRASSLPPPFFSLARSLTRPSVRQDLFARSRSTFGLLILAFRLLWR